MSRTLRIVFLALFLPLVWGTSARAQGGKANFGQRSPADDNVGVGIEQVGVLVYPSKMLYEGIDSGEVRAAISVDSDGNLKDCMITAYTMPEFADAVLAALKRWRYHPAKANGRPTASCSDLLVEFRSEGVVVQTLPGAMVRHAFDSLDEHYRYKPSQLRDLDRIPTPVHVVTPVANSDDQIHSVTVEFYIDEQGNVRMAAVPRTSAGDAYAAAAVAAVEQWRFEPPLRRGQPVLVLAQQEFNFRPKK
jgi:TonB family protein